MNKSIRQIVKEVIAKEQASDLPVGTNLVCIHGGVVPIIEGDEARSAVVYEGDKFVISDSNSAYYFGYLMTKGTWKRHPNLSGKNQFLLDKLPINIVKVLFGVEKRFVNSHSLDVDDFFATFEVVNLNEQKITNKDDSSMIGKPGIIRVIQKIDDWLEDKLSEKMFVSYLEDFKSSSHYPANIKKIVSMIKNQFPHDKTYIPDIKRIYKLRNELAKIQVERENEYQKNLNEQKKIDKDDITPDKDMNYDDLIEDESNDEDLDEDEEESDYDPSKPYVKLVGKDGNAFSIIGFCHLAAKKAKWTPEQWKKVQKEMMSGDYDNLLAVAMTYFDVH